MTAEQALRMLWSEHDVHVSFSSLESPVWRFSADGMTAEGTSFESTAIGLLDKLYAKDRALAHERIVILRKQLAEAEKELATLTRE